MQIYRQSNFPPLENFYSHGFADNINKFAGTTSKLEVPYQLNYFPVKKKIKKYLIIFTLYYFLISPLSTPALSSEAIFTTSL